MTDGPWDALDELLEGGYGPAFQLLDVLADADRLRQLVAPFLVSKRSRELWRKTTADFMLEATELELLRLAPEALDRAEQARVIPGRRGDREHRRVRPAAGASLHRGRARQPLGGGSVVEAAGAARGARRVFLAARASGQKAG